MVPPGMDLSRRFIFREIENVHLYGPYESVTARMGAVRDRSIRISVLDEGASRFYLFIDPRLNSQLGIRPNIE